MWFGGRSLKAHQFAERACSGVVEISREVVARYLGEEIDVTGFWEDDFVLSYLSNLAFELAKWHSCGKVSPAKLETISLTIMQKLTGKGLSKIHGQTVNAAHNSDFGDHAADIALVHSLYAFGYLKDEERNFSVLKGKVLLDEPGRKWAQRLANEKDWIGLGNGRDAVWAATVIADFCIFWVQLRHPDKL